MDVRPAKVPDRSPGDRPVAGRHPPRCDLGRRLPAGTPRACTKGMVELYYVTLLRNGQTSCPRYGRAAGYGRRMECGAEHVRCRQPPAARQRGGQASEWRWAKHGVHVRNKASAVRAGLREESLCMCACVCMCVCVCVCSAGGSASGRRGGAGYWLHLRPQAPSHWQDHSACRRQTLRHEGSDGG